MTANLRRQSVLPVLVFAATFGLAAGLARSQAPPDSNAPPGAEPKLQLPVFGFSKSAGQSENQVAFAGSFTVAKASRRGTLSLKATIEPGWHVYSVTQQRGGPMPSKITVIESPQFKVLGPFRPDQPPHVKQLDIYKVPVEEHEGTVTWSAPIELAEGVNPEDLIIKLHYAGQVCSQVCIPLNNVQVAASFAGYAESAPALGEYRPAENQAQLVLRGHLEPAAAAPGGKVRLVLTAIPNPGWHVYAYAPTDPDVVGVNKPTLIALVLPPGWTRSAVRESAVPKEKPPLKPEFPKERYHEEPVTWTIDLTAPADAAGEAVLTGFIGFQTCKEGCLPPQGVKFSANIPLGETAAAGGTIPLEFAAARYSEAAKLAAQATTKPAAAAAATPTSATGFLLAAVLGLAGGLILNLMPCVLPVIGLKVLSFAQQGGQSRARIFGLNVAFVLGILAVFMILATAAVFFGQNWGEQFTYTWFKVAMVVLVFAFALSFLGVWEVPIPGFAMTSTSAKLQQQEGAVGAFFKGVFTTLLSTPCSGPLLGPLFLYALSQTSLVAYTIYGCIGLGMGLPYLVIGAFPGLVRWLPKPGEWMETVKEVMGFVLLATVVYLFWTINPAYFVPTLGLVVAVWFGLWIVGRVPLYESTSKQLFAWARGIAAAAVLGWTAFALFGPANEAQKQEGLAWQPYSEPALQALQREGKTIMLDFTANWCLTCQYNTKFAIDTPKVKELVEKNGVVPMVADWTDQNAEIKAKLDELASRSIPLLAIYPAGRPGEVIVLRDALVESQVLEALQKAGPSQSTLTAGGPAATKSTAEAAAQTPPSG